MKESALWQDLEAKIGRAIEEIEALRTQNRKLSSRMKRLQRETADKPTAWEAEKKQLRDRVERLVETLESLL